MYRKVIHIMKEVKKEKRVVNIPKEDFDNIKRYCDENSLDMPKWMVKNSLEKLNEELPSGKMTAKKAKEISNKSQQISIPKNWLEVVMKKIDEKITFHITEFNSSNEICWAPVIEAVNIYGRPYDFNLTEDQIGMVEKELVERGFNLVDTSKIKDSDYFHCYTPLTKKWSRYKITW